MSFHHLLYVSDKEGFNSCEVFNLVKCLCCFVDAGQSRKMLTNNWWSLSRSAQRVLTSSRNLADHIVVNLVTSLAIRGFPSIFLYVLVHKTCFTNKQAVSYTKIYKAFSIISLHAFQTIRTRWMTVLSFPNLIW